MSDERRDLPKSIVIVGRRWFEKINGNTYNVARVYVDGELVSFLPFEYGYGNHYLTRADEALEALSYMPGREHSPNGSAEPGWKYFRDRNVTYTYEVVDVARKRDL